MDVLIAWFTNLDLLTKIILCVGSGAFIVFVKKYSDFFDWFQMRRLNRVISLEKNAESKELKELLSRTREEELFSIATGIKAEGSLKQYLDLIERANGMVTIQSLRRAKRYLERDVKGNLQVRKITLADNILSWLSFALYFVILLIFLASAFYSFDVAYKAYFAKPPSFSLDAAGLSIAALFSLSLVIFGVYLALWVLQGSVELASAKRLHSHLTTDRTENYHA